MSISHISLISTYNSFSNSEYSLHIAAYFISYPFLEEGDINQALPDIANEKLSGIIDYYFSCNDFYAFEIAICLNALCFEGKNENLSFNVS